MKRSTLWGKGVSTTKTSIEIPDGLWRAAKIRALDEKRNFQEVVAEALAEYLKKPKKGGERR